MPRPRGTRPRRLRFALAPLLGRARRPGRGRLGRFACDRTRRRDRLARLVPARRSGSTGVRARGRRCPRRPAAELCLSLRASATIGSWCGSEFSATTASVPERRDARPAAAHPRLALVQHGRRTGLVRGRRRVGRNLDFRLGRRGVGRSSRDRRQHLERRLGRRSMMRLGGGMGITHGRAVRGCASTRSSSWCMGRVVL